MMPQYLSEPVQPAAIEDCNPIIARLDSILSYHSFWAICSLLLNGPWLLALGWCLFTFLTANRPIAGEIFLLPVFLGFFSYCFVFCSGCFALRSSRWLIRMLALL